jgi:capsular polysaccharide biosynthesis protein
MELGDFLRLLLRRSWLIVLLVAAAGVNGWIAVKDDPKIYEHSVHSVLGPSPQVQPVHIPAALQTLDEEGPVVNTVRGVLGSDRLLKRAAADALGSELPPSYKISSSIVPGSTIMETTLSGPHPERLEALGRSFARIAAEWVDENYRAYNLELLETEDPGAPVSPQVRRVVALAAALGGLFAFAIILLEAAIFTRPRLARQRAREARQAVVSVHDLTGRTDRLEDVLRPHLEEGEALVRVGRQQLAIERVPPATLGPNGERPVNDGDASRVRPGGERPVRDAESSRSTPVMKRGIRRRSRPRS